MMSKGAKFFAAIGVVGIMLSAGGCETVSQTMEIFDRVDKNRQKALEQSLENGAPTIALEPLLRDAEQWIVATAPNLSQVQDGYQKYLVVGPTKNLTETMSQREVDIKSSQLYSRLQSYQDMDYRFDFIDRTTDHSLEAYTGDPSVLKNSLSSGGATPGRDEYLPNDIYYVVLEFQEERFMADEPEQVVFTLVTKLGWGGNQGQNAAQQTFSKRLQYDEEMSGFSGRPGNWFIVE